MEIKDTEIKGALAIHHTPVDKEGAWDAGQAVKNLGDEPTAAALVKLHAWVDPEGEKTAKSSYKFPHHNVAADGKVGAANMKAAAAVIAALNGGRGGAKIPDADRKGVYAHVKAHYKDADIEVPDLKASISHPTSYMTMEVKEMTEEGTFEGWLSPYGNTDLGGDVVEPGAYTKTLKERGNIIPMLWQHKTDCPIGELALEDRKEGLWCKGALLMALPEAQKAYLLIKARIVKGLSIGFESIKDAIEGGVRHLKEIKLYEGSIVTFPMNEAAMISTVKSTETKEDFTTELQQIQIMQGFSQIMGALDNALWSIVWADDLDTEQKIAAADLTITQFSETFSTFFPSFLEMREKIMERWQRGEFETKEGRTFSTANMKTITSACEQIKTGYESLMALLENGKAVETDTSPTKAADPKPEPGDDDHSAAALRLRAAEGIKSLRSILKGEPKK